MSRMGVQVMRHLQTRAQFQALLERRPQARTRHFALHRLPLAASPAAAADSSLGEVFARRDGLWLGAMVPKRWARRAVRRNAIRRQIYAVGAQLLAHSSGAHLVRLRAPYDPSRFRSASSAALKQAVRTELLQLLGQQSS